MDQTDIRDIHRKLNNYAWKTHSYNTYILG
jgi:hypothetical protein